MFSFLWLILGCLCMFSKLHWWFYRGCRLRIVSTTWVKRSLKCRNRKLFSSKRENLLSIDLVLMSSPILFSLVLNINRMRENMYLLLTFFNRNKQRMIQFYFSRSIFLMRQRTLSNRSWWRKLVPGKVWDNLSVFLSKIRINTAGKGLERN